MNLNTQWLKVALVALLSVGLASSQVPWHKKKYENPITKDTQQPDKVLFDKAMNDIEHGRYEVARITLNTLINTYDSSEYLAKAKLAIADSWYREGGANGLAQAEAEYKDFILFYPAMQEAAEAQNRICMIHYNQMDKADRDDTQAVRANYECLQVIQQFPNSKYAPIAMQTLRNIQEALAEHEFDVGHYYYHKGSNPAAANRLDDVAAQYPLFSKADVALYEAGLAYMDMGPRFRQRAGDDFAKIVRDYPLGSEVGNAKKKLGELEMPVPEPNQEALNQEKYDQEHYVKQSLIKRETEIFFKAPDMSHAAQTGQPAMVMLKPTLPVSIPVQNTAEAAPPAGAAGAPAGTNEVKVEQLNDAGSKALNEEPDARKTVPSTPETQPAAQAQPAAQGAMPSNHAKDIAAAQAEAAKKYKKAKKNKNQTTAPASTPAATPADQSGQPATAPTPAGQTPPPAGQTPPPAATQPPAPAPTTPPQQ
jgi:outer membrane protein assembly factor BamD